MKRLKMGVHPTFVIPVETNGRTIADAVVDFNRSYKEKYDRDFDMYGYEIRHNSVKVAIEKEIEDGDIIYFVQAKSNGSEEVRSEDLNF